jgi:hypothetical protein
MFTTVACLESIHACHRELIRCDLSTVALDLRSFSEGGLCEGGSDLGFSQRG